MPHEIEFQIRRAKNGGYWWHLVAANNRSHLESDLLVPVPHSNGMAYPALQGGPER